MAQVAPFRGLHYNPAQVSQLVEVVTPPYDVIRPDEREAFAARHPNNMVHLILPQALPGDSLLYNRYTRAASLFRQWQQEGVLVRDSEPAYYYWETEFQNQGRHYTRMGLAALVRLEPLGGGVILPHEQTYSAIKADRLELLKHAQAHFSPIFALFPDRSGEILGQLRQCRPPEPLEAFEDVEGRRQTIYPVTDPACLAAVHQALAPLPLYIADGHHRYETALAFQKWLKARYPAASPRASFNYVLMYLANLYDPDLVILMAHRLLGGPRLKHLKETALLNRLADYFEPTLLSGPTSDLTAYADFLQQSLTPDSPTDTVFIMLGFGLKAWRLKLREGVRKKLLAREMHPALAKLDVSVLNYLIFDRILGLNAQAMDDPETCKYSSKLNEVLSALSRKEVNLAFLLNPTQIEQVQEVAGAGLIMPRKSTYFYPKVMTGLLLNPINPTEEIFLPEAPAVKKGSKKS
ncbi:MAG: hypothetical protein A2Y80_06100 [Deltaproteobacteria bacterium RBG_13_58_19]|nr:MAG: hypothetical protein A2Y80_06100 [Deltaproteobacteria bacterium RBG_13_58_19]